MINENLKYCKKCNQSKPLDDFHNDKNRKGGKYNYCKECHYSYVRERHKDPIVKNRKRLYYESVKNTDQFKKSREIIGRRFYESLEGRAKTLLNNAKKSPISKKFPITLTIEHIIKGIEKGICPVTGMSFQMNNDFQLKTGAKKNPYSPSLDRINPKIGYTNENVRVVIWQYNMAKGELSDEEFKNLCKKVIEHVSIP